nr:uncharacterized protein LOC126525887 [Dermacentor andersoni]
MIQRLILVCMALPFACRMDAEGTSAGEISECERVMKAIYNCSEKYEYYLPEEFFKRVESHQFVQEASRCIDDSTPIREALRGCDSEVAMTIAAHCIRARMFEIVPVSYKYSVLRYLDDLVVCMAELLQRPLAYLQRAFQSTV